MAKASDWNGTQIQGSSVTLFQTMKSGSPSLPVWIGTVFSFSAMAMQYDPMPKVMAWPRFRIPA